MNNIEAEVDTTATPSTSQNKLGTCEVCASNPAKYACPRCDVKTCCLRCVNIHKEELQCDGIIDKTKFIPLGKFTNMDLLRDYRLLEELSRKVASLKKLPAREFTRSTRYLPKHLLRLHAAVYKRKTSLKFLPRGFAKHKWNTTYLDFKTNVVFWHVEWIFVNADNLRFYDDKVPETAKLSSLLYKHLLNQEDRVIQQKLQFYQSSDLPGIKLLLRAEGKSERKYFELNPLTSLKDNLENKTIIEYPIIHVVLKEHANSYDVLNSDDEDEDTTVNNQNGGQIVDQMIKKAEKEESSSNSLKNLLFVSGASDEEVSDED